MKTITKNCYFENVKFNKLDIILNLDLQMYPIFCKNHELNREVDNFKCRLRTKLWLRHNIISITRCLKERMIEVEGYRMISVT